MASNYSFDVVSDIDLQEVDNAVNQSTKEINQRYDFKGSSAEILLKDNEIRLKAENEFKLEAVRDVLRGKFAKRGLSVRALNFKKVENGTLGSARQTVELIKGISKEKAKEIVLEIKNSKIKVQAQILDDVVRISSKDKDDLQQAIILLKSKDFEIDLQFQNYR